MPRVRVSNEPGEEAWAWIGYGTALSSRSRGGGHSIGSISREAPPKAASRQPPPDDATLVGATPRQLEALDTYISCGTHRATAKRMGIGERRLYRLLDPLKEKTGLSVVQLVMVRNRDLYHKSGVEKRRVLGRQNGTDVHHPGRTGGDSL